MMARCRTGLVWVLALVLTAVMGATTRAQAPAAQTASQFYTQYRVAFDKATKIDDLFPFMSAASRKLVESTPAAQRPMRFDMMKTMGTLTDVKILKEEKTATGATLTVEGVDGTKQKVTGTIAVVREGGAWKLGSENWSN